MPGAYTGRSQLAAGSLCRGQNCTTAARSIKIQSNRVNDDEKRKGYRTTISERGAGLYHPRRSANMGQDTLQFVQAIVADHQLALAGLAMLDLDPGTEFLG